MENVYGLSQVKSANMIEEIYKSFEEIGYQITHRELMAADYAPIFRKIKTKTDAVRNIDSIYRNR
jgi:hypothetical protein